MVTGPVRPPLLAYGGEPLADDSQAARRCWELVDLLHTHGPMTGLAARMRLRWRTIGFYLEVLLRSGLIRRIPATPPDRYPTYAVVRFPTMHQLDPCELCGQNGSCVVVDVQEIPSDDQYRRWMVHSRHTFCDRHARPEIRYPIQEAPR